MDKYDVRKQFKELYAPRTRDFEVIAGLDALRLETLDEGLSANPAHRQLRRRRACAKLRTVLRQPVRLH